MLDADSRAEGGDVCHAVGADYPCQDAAGDGHQEVRSGGRQSDIQNPAPGGQDRAPADVLEYQQVLGLAQDDQRGDQGQGAGQHGGQGGPADAHRGNGAEPEDEDWIQNDVQAHVGQHDQAWGQCVARGADGIVADDGNDEEDHPRQPDAEIPQCQGKRGGVGAEQRENSWNGQPTGDQKDSRDEKAQEQRVQR
jgi:hypothetical protein